MKNYYDVLPENYKEKYAIDAKNKKTSILLNVVGIALMLLVIEVFFYFKKFFDKNVFKDAAGDKYYLIYLFGFLAAYLLYIVLHELTHGLFYKIFTKEKLTFGFNGIIAWCGLKNGYFNKKTGLFAILAPFVIYTIVLVPLCIITNGFLSFMLILLFAAHFGGCIGDIYGTIIMIKMPKDVLINDNGYKQTFYVPVEEN